MIPRYTLRKKMKDAEAEKLRATYINEDNFDELIVSDCDLYDVSGKMIARFRKNVLSIDLLKSGYEAFKGSIVGSHNRGDSAGGYYHETKKDGTTSNARMSRTVESGIVGSLEAGGLTPYCRLTAFTADYFETYKKGIPFVKAIDSLYRELAPDQWKIQREYAKATNQNYIIGGTAFSTVTVNKNFRTAVHTDHGDLEKGFGNLIVYREGKWSGGYFCLPQYRVAFDLQNTDVLFVDVHQLHGNTPFYPSEQAETSGEPEMPEEWTEGNLRISFVLYYREEIIKCPSPTNELKKMKNKFKFDKL